MLTQFRSWVARIQISSISASNLSTPAWGEIRFSGIYLVGGGRQADEPYFHWLQGKKKEIGK
jgi:hypothetical protein